MASQGYTRVQLERELERVVRKQARGEKLTRKEQRILAYGRPAGCPSGIRSIRVL